MDYKAIARAITDPENQPHQWNEQELARFFISAADEIERLREENKELKAEDKRLRQEIMHRDNYLKSVNLLADCLLSF